MCHGQGCRVFLGMGKIPHLIGNPYNWNIKPYYWVDEFIPYYMEMSWEFRADRTNGSLHFWAHLFFAQRV